jgi:glutamate decarboxylase
LSAALDRLQERTGLDIPIHVDGASGAFVAPFIQPDLVWDFQLPRVKSINTSGHKYGLVYPGVGWIVWREASDLHPDLIFNVDYLGGTMPTLAINFSRPASQVVAQYYNLIRLGKSGYRAIHQACQDVAVNLAGQIGEMGPFELLSDGRDLPVFAWTLKDPTQLVAVRSGGPAARSRLAGARLPHARQPAGSGGAARGGAQRLHPRSGRNAAARHPPAPGLVRHAARSQTDPGRRGLPSLGAVSGNQLVRAGRHASLP